MPSIDLRSFRQCLMGSLGQQRHSLFSFRSARKLFFLVWTYAVKSPVIKQLEGLLWEDLVPWGRCQSDCNQDLHRPLLLMAFSNFNTSLCPRLINHSCEVFCTALMLRLRQATQAPIREAVCEFRHPMAYGFVLCFKLLFSSVEVCVWLFNCSLYAQLSWVSILNGYG